jgi:Zn-dependent M32 family carboxypeptidase
MTDIKWTNEMEEIVADIERAEYRVAQLRVDLENHYPSVGAKRRSGKDVTGALSVINQALTALEEMSSTLFYAGAMHIAFGKEDK